MRRIGWFLLLIVVAGVAVTGCATMVHGTTQEIPVTSDPPGAEVRLGGRLLGVTPTTITLERKPDYQLEILKPGFEPFRQRLESVSQYDALSVLGGGLIGWGIDASTGGNKRLYPERVHAALSPGDGMQPAVRPATSAPLVGTWMSSGGQMLVITSESATRIAWEFTSADRLYVAAGSGDDAGQAFHWTGFYVTSPQNNSAGRTFELHLQPAGETLVGKIITGTRREYDVVFSRAR